MSALYRSVVFNRVSKLNTCLIQVMRFGYNAPPPQWKTPDSLQRAGNTSRSQDTTNPKAMANISRKLSVSCSRCLSTSPESGANRVKRVSIEGNIGKISIGIFTAFQNKTIILPSYECCQDVQRSFI